MGLLTLLLIFASSFLILLSPLFIQIYATMVTGFLSAFGLYCGGNVVNKLVTKGQPLVAEESQELPQIEFPEEK